MNRSHRKGLCGEGQELDLNMPLKSPCDIRLESLSGQLDIWTWSSGVRETGLGWELISVHTMTKAT